MLQLLFACSFSYRTISTPCHIEMALLNNRNERVRVVLMYFDSHELSCNVIYANPLENIKIWTRNQWYNRKFNSVVRRNHFISITPMMFFGLGLGAYEPSIIPTNKKTRGNAYNKMGNNIFLATLSDQISCSCRSKTCYKNINQRKSFFHTHNWYFKFSERIHT